MTHRSSSRPTDHDRPSRFAPYLDAERPRERGTASGTVTDILREAILDGVIAPRTWLREAELAEELGVSRTPIRDAFRTLGSEGLLDLSANKGAMVAPLTGEDIVELYTIREALEGLAAKLAARRSTSSDVEPIERIIDDMRTAVRDRRYQDLHVLDLLLHREIRRVADNRYVDRSLVQIENAVRRFRDTTYLVEGRAEESLAEHEALAAAILARDAVSAERIAAEHMRRLAELRLRMLLDGY